MAIGVVRVFLFWLIVMNTFASTSTDVRLYRPFEKNVVGQVTPVMSEISTGTCSQYSQRDHRSDAWQCQVGERVLDPCFIKIYVKPTQAICPVSPWQTQAVTVDIRAQQLPQNNHHQENLDMSTDDPWAIDLMDGTHCMMVSDSNLSAQGQPVKYSCDNQGFLLGHIQRCELIWKMLFLPSYQSDVLNTVEIATAWY